MSNAILIVEDEAFFSEALQRFLSSQGLEVTCLPTSSGVPDKVKAQEFKAVFIDYALPGTTGVSLLKEIKLLRPELPVFLITASWLPKVERAALAAGARKVIQKPFELADLMKEIWDCSPDS